MNYGGSDHDALESRGRLSGAEAAAEFASWRELTAPETRPLVPDVLPPLPPDLFRLFHRLRLRYARLAGPELLACARFEGWDHVRLLRALLAEEAVGRDRATRELHRQADNGLPALRTE